MRRNEGDKQRGFSLTEIMVSVAIVLILAFMTRGRGDFMAMMSGQSPNDSFREIARLYAPKLCSANESGVPIEQCVKFGKSNCVDEARKVIFRCTLFYKGAVPPLMNPEEQRLLMQVSAKCIQEQWRKTLFEKFEIDVKNPKCH